MLVALALGLLINEEIGHASTGSSFSVQPKISDDQASNLGYFDLTLRPGQENIVQVEVFNDSEEQIEVVAEINTATTSNVGNISYLQTNNVDDSLVHNIQDIVKSDNKNIILTPKESKVVNFAIKMPEEKFTGILLGGLRFTLAEKDKEIVGIENRFAYTVGIVLSNLPEELPVNLNLIDITVGQLNYRNHILVKLQNDVPRIIDQMDVTAEVYPKDKNTVLYSSQSSGLRMAPNSSFQYGISTDETAFKPGEYTLKLVATADGKEFEWTQDFEIAKDEADSFNKDAILVEEQSNTIWMWISFIAIGICGVFGILYFKKQKNT